jgi:hypothetical protein
MGVGVPSRLAIATGMALVAALTIGLPVRGAAGEDATPPERAGAIRWDWQPSLLYYVLAGGDGYFQPTLAANRGGLHLEGRYNYEARETGSAWVGWNLRFGEEWTFGLTPMLGAVFGQLKGIAPGLTFTLDWGPLALWSQSEYVFGLTELSQSYLYHWSELSVTGPGWLRIGLVLQRTHAFRTDTEVQGGPLVGFTFWKLSATAYLFAPGQMDQFVVVSAAGAF